MTDRFEIGEIAIVIPELHEVEIIGKEKIRYGFNREGKPIHSGVPVYGTKSKDGFIGWCASKYLRKKKPPQESKDIQETREKGVPSFNKIMEQMMK